MTFFDKLKGRLQRAFASPAPDDTVTMPEKIMVPLVWPELVSRHIPVNTTETIATQICAARWAAVSENMRSTLNPSAPNYSEHRAFIGHINALRANILMSNKDMIHMDTNDLVAVYEQRHLFDEIGGLLSTRETDLSNVILFRNATITSGAAEADAVKKFKEKYTEMMETALLPFLNPGWAKQNAKPAEEAPGTAPWGRSGRRPF